jgi:hypothetical protein
MDEERRACQLGSISVATEDTRIVLSAGGSPAMSSELLFYFL